MRMKVKLTCHAQTLLPHTTEGHTPKTRFVDQMRDVVARGNFLLIGKR